MKLGYKIVLINLGVAIIITLISVAMYNTGFGASDTAFAFGIVCLGLGIINVVVGLAMLISGNKEWGSGFLLSGAGLLLLSGISCGGGLSGMKF